MPQPTCRAPFCLAVLALLALAGPARAADDGSGALRIEQPWSRATAPGAAVGVGYLVIVNEGARDDRLLGGETPVAGRVTLHRSVEEDGTSRMEHQDEGIPVPAGERVVLEPGGYHLMLMQLGQRLEKGDSVPLTLRFERAGAIEVELEVRGLTAGVE